jgi:hypothetical protein
MAFKTATEEPQILTLATTVVLFNLLLGIVGVVACTFVSDGVATGFFLGFLISCFNQYLCIQIARKGISMAPERAQSFVATRYFVRFALTASVLAVLLLKTTVNPWALVMGYVVTFFVVIATVALFMRRQMFNPFSQGGEN